MLLFHVLDFTLTNLDHFSPVRLIPGKAWARGRVKRLKGLNKNRNLVSKAFSRTSRLLGLRAPLLFPGRLPARVMQAFLMLIGLYQGIGKSPNHAACAHFDVEERQCDCLLPNWEVSSSGTPCPYQKSRVEKNYPVCSTICKINLQQS